MAATLASAGMSDSQRPEVAIPAVAIESDTVVALVFAFKTFAAGLLAFFLAFWPGLDEPNGRL